MHGWTSSCVARDASFVLRSTCQPTEKVTGPQVPAAGLDHRPRAVGSTNVGRTGTGAHRRHVRFYERGPDRGPSHGRPRERGRFATGGTGASNGPGRGRRAEGHDPERRLRRAAFVVPRRSISPESGANVIRSDSFGRATKLSEYKGHGRIQVGAVEKRPSQWGSARTGPASGDTQEAAVRGQNAPTHRLAGK